MVAEGAEHSGLMPALPGRVLSESQLDCRSPFVKQFIIFFFGVVFGAVLRPRPSINFCPGPCWLASALKDCLLQYKYVFLMVRDILADPAT